MIMMILLPTDGQGLWAESQHVVTASSILSISSPAEDQQRMKAVDVFLIFFYHVSHVLYGPHVLYGLRGSNCNVSWFICWFWCYINCMFVYLTSFLVLSSFFILSYLLIYFLTRLLPYLSASSRIDPFHLQGGGCRSQPNLALVFWVHFML